MDDDGHRLDKWLWYCRFYKTRSLATAAIAGGKVHLNGERIKPAHLIRVGDRISLSLQGIVAEFEVLGRPQRPKGTTWRPPTARSGAPSCEISNGSPRRRGRGPRGAPTNATVVDSCVCNASRPSDARPLSEVHLPVKSGRRTGSRGRQNRSGGPFRVAGSPNWLPATQPLPDRPSANRATSAGDPGGSRAY